MNAGFPHRGQPSSGYRLGRRAVPIAAALAVVAGAGAGAAVLTNGGGAAPHPPAAGAAPAGHVDATGHGGAGAVAPRGPAATGTGSASGTGGTGTATAGTGTATAGAGTVTGGAAPIDLVGSPATADLPRPTNTGPVVSADPSARPPVTEVTGVRTGVHPGFDRIVFTLAGPTTGYRVEYVSTLVRDGSGTPVRLAGGAVLRVVLHAADAHDAAGHPTCAGCAVLDPALPNLRQVKLAGDFEGYVTFGLGLDHRAGFRVFRLADPTRIVVDIAH